MDMGPLKASVTERTKLRKCQRQQVAGEASQSQMVQRVFSGINTRWRKKKMQDLPEGEIAL